MKIKLFKKSLLISLIVIVFIIISFYFMIQKCDTIILFRNNVAQNINLSKICYKIYNVRYIIFNIYCNNIDINCNKLIENNIKNKFCISLKCPIGNEED